jgi:putative aldouronate transport system permease protein
MPSAMAAAKKTSPNSLKYAAMIITSVPIIIVYPFLQKYFVKGVLIGSVKG